MEVSQDLAQTIIAQLSKSWTQPLSFMNSYGYIVASTDRTRLGLQHQGAIIALKDHRDLVVDGRLQADLPNTQEGITVPLYLNMECIGALGVSGDPCQLSESVVLLKLAALSLIKVWQLEHLSGNHTKVLNAWINDLTSDQIEDYDLLAQQAAYLNIDMSMTSAMIFINIHNILAKMAPRLEASITECVGKFSNLQFIAYIGHGRFLLSIEAGTLDDRDFLGGVGSALCQTLCGQNQNFHIGIGRPDSGMDGFRRSYLDAFHSARIAERLSSAKHVLYYYECHFFRLLESVPDYVRDTFINNQLEARRLDSVQLNTLKTYFAMNRHLNETATALYVHRNTLLFRLKKIHEILGLDPQNFHDSVALQVLLYFIDLKGMGSDK